MYCHGMQAAFVNIGSGKNAFIHLKDVLPKVDVTKETVTEKEDILSGVQKEIKSLCNEIYEMD